MKKFVYYLLLAVFLLSLPGAASAKLLSGVFVDIQGHWAESEIETAYNHGLMLGTGTNEYSFKTFSPEENVNRFQLAAVLERAFDLDYGNKFIKKPVASDYYCDLEEEAWYSEAVVLGAINHIFTQKGEFKGQEEVSRIEVARSIYNAFQAKGINVPMIMLMPLYDDTADLTQEDTNAMVFVSNTGIMKGNDNLFRPNDPISRAELARVLNQCVKLIEMNPVEVDPNKEVETVVQKLVTDFGSKLKNVSLLAPEDVLKNSIQESYGDLVSPALLATWQSDLKNVPGRGTSSPWPERIEIISMEKISDSRYEIKGEIIRMTSVEMVNGGVAGKNPITLEAEKIQNRWLITSYENNEVTVYRNGEYGFSFSLPDSWQGYSVVTDQWEGTNHKSAVTEENGPLVSIRHPQWTAQNPRQDIPIMVFTHNQWNLLQERKFSVGAAPIPPKELGRNTKYVFALPARYNFAFPTGYEEVEKILENNPLKVF
jgi:hypothetical protein